MRASAQCANGNVRRANSVCDFSSSESDVPAELRVANGSQKFVNFTSTIQNQLLLVSLLEHLCHMYTHNPVHSRCLFRS